jgi:drug/metabolite transporter (DMT)-like permease
VAGTIGLVAFYRALAIGTMSIVAPVASTGVALPVIVGLAGGDDPGLARSLGIVVAVVGVVLASRESGDGVDQRRRRLSVLLALAAGIGFGSYFVGAQIAARDSVAWTLLLSRVAATPLVAVAAIVTLRRGAPRPDRKQVSILAGMGLIDLAANTLYAQATTLGPLSTVAVAGSLYPVMTVLLASILLGERVRGIQRAGVIASIAGVLLIAGGASA